MWMSRSVNVFVRMVDGTVRVIPMTNGYAQGRVLSGLWCGVAMSSFLPELAAEISALTGYPASACIIAFIDDMGIRVPKNRPELHGPILEAVRNSCGVQLATGMRCDHP